MTDYPAARTYVHRIRNIRKQAYAAQYFGWITGENRQEPSADGLSYMAAQAVRMRLHELLGPRRG